MLLNGSDMARYTWDIHIKTHDKKQNQTLQLDQMETLSRVFSCMFRPVFSYWFFSASIVYSLNIVKEHSANELSNRETGFSPCARRISLCKFLSELPTAERAVEKFSFRARIH